METIIIISIVVISILYIALHHLFNWGWRKIEDGEPLVPITFGYVILNILYWTYLLNALKLII